MHFRIFNFPVTIEPMFWLISLLAGFAFGNSLLTIVIFTAALFIGILVHELGHAFTARWYGGQNTSIALHGFGGATTWNPSRRLSWRESFLIAISGPALGFVPGLIAAAVLFTPSPPTLVPELKSFLAYLFFISIIWGMVNLVPLRPMDGFQALSSLLSRHRSSPPSWIEGISVASGVLLVLTALHFGLFFAAVMFAYFTWLSIRQMRHC
jgi:Zn-dependent protease